jgi:hypothetical protein
MKRKLLSVISILVIAALSACGPKATPTMSVADIQSTAMADAWIALTQTQAAMPTATETPIPPTPTLTLTPPPTVEFIIPTLVPATLPNTAIDPCNDVPPAEPKGAKAKVQFFNKSNSNLNLLFGMLKENDKKECGTYSFTLGRYENPTVEVLAGCYWSWAWVLDPPSIAKNPEVLCVTETDFTYSIWITAEVVSFH